jgi:hypothetical protein
MPAPLIQQFEASIGCFDTSQATNERIEENKKTSNSWLLFPTLSTKQLSNRPWVEFDKGLHSLQ